MYPQTLIKVKGPDWLDMKVLMQQCIPKSNDLLIDVFVVDQIL
jgi:hypothetical protein